MLYPLFTSEGDKYFLLFSCLVSLFTFTFLSLFRQDYRMSPNSPEQTHHTVEPGAP